MNDSVISQHLQDCFTLLAITDDKFLRAAHDSVKPKYFSSEITEDIVNLCYNYYLQFGEAPGNHLHDELARFLLNKEDEKKGQYLTYLERIQGMSIPNKEYIISRINKFIQAREFETATIQFVKLIEKGEFIEGRELMQRALRTGIVKEEVGVRYFAQDLPTYYGEDGNGRQKVLMPTGFRIIDDVIKGFRRKDFVCVLAGYKVGKTWGGVHFGIEGLKQGLKVLHVSHEASQEEIEMRYDMALGSLTSEEHPEDITFVEYDENGLPIDTVVMERDTVFNLPLIQGVRKKAHRYGGDLIIKKYPMGSCTISELERYMDYLETYEKFIPDLVINDYIEKMKMPLSEAAAQRDRINQAYIDHKRIADERNIVVITMSQIKTQSLEKKIISQRDSAAEDMRKLGNIDVGLLLSQTRIQEQNNRMQAYVLVNRSNKMSFGCVVSKNLRVGQLVLDCWPLRAETPSVPTNSPPVTGEDNVVEN
jgi:replicative DNA helicase